MKQKKPETKSKLKKIFSFLCSGEQESITSSPEKKDRKQFRTIKKQPRQTLSFDQAFLKISRKNIVEEQFLPNDLITLQLERHISKRLQKSLTVLIKGEFSQEISKRIVSPIYLESYSIKENDGRQFLYCNTIPKFRKGTIDALVYQTTGSYSSQKSEQVIDELVEIELILKKYYKSVENIIFICTKKTSLEEMNNLFLVFSEYYLYEIQKIKKNEKTIAYVIYVSVGPQLLKINEKWFKTFLIQQLENEEFEKEQISNLIHELVENKFYKEILNIVRLLKRKKCPQYELYYSFMEDLSERYPATKSIVEPYLKKQIQTSFINRQTPLFGQKVQEQATSMKEENTAFNYQGSFF